jgi:hypothetical protein
MPNQLCSLRASFVWLFITNTAAEKSNIYTEGSPDLSREKRLISTQFRREHFGFQRRALNPAPF